MRIAPTDLTVSEQIDSDPMNDSNKKSDSAEDFE